MLRGRVSKLLSLGYRTDYHSRCGRLGTALPVLISAVGYDVGTLLATMVRHERSRFVGALTCTYQKSANNEGKHGHEGEGQNGSPLAAAGIDRPGDNQRPPPPPPPPVESPVVRKP